MRVLFISTIYPTPAEPGKGVFNGHLVRGLARRHEVTVLAPVPWTADPPWRSAAGLNSDRARDDAGVPVLHPRYYYPPRCLHSRTHHFYWWSVRGVVNRCLQSFRPNLVLSYWAHPDGAVAVQIAREWGSRSAVIVGGSDVLLLTRSPSRQKQIASVLRAANAVVSVSEHLRQHVLHLGAAPACAFLWQQGVDTAMFQPGDRFAARDRLGILRGVPLLLWVGRMVPVKGLDVLIAACRRLRERGITFHLALVGDGPLRPALEVSCRLSGIADRVSFVGACPQEQLADWYRAADVTVLPSRSEGLPNVLRESISCGTPFVASAVGGVAEIADRELDRLVPPEDPERLADALTAALAARNLRPPRRFQPENWAESAERLVELVCHGEAP